LNKIYILKNSVQEYAWGSHEAIPGLLGGHKPSEKPQAELWMGAHPKAPSQINVDDRWISLAEIIEKNPIDILGEKVAGRFHRKLPYLFKVLAAAKPLSIQAHPNLVQAKSGYRRENELNIPVDAPNRNYRDDNHKPECICALTSFWALNGFRPISDVLAYFIRLSGSILAEELHDFQNSPNSSGLKRFFKELMMLNPGRGKALIQRALSQAGKESESDPAFRWMASLGREYPLDIGIFSPILLNLVHLEPGQAMFLPAGNLHAYLQGTGIELMANSDNVLRGGLTPKHIDVDELLKVVDFSETPVDILKPVQIENGEYRYPTDADEFYLSVLRIERDKPFCSKTDRSVEILLCTKGRASISHSGLNDHLIIEKGISVLIPAASNAYAIEGNAEIYKAATPLG
jgi:mannose-6-phosphate isomerase